MLAEVARRSTSGMARCSTGGVASVCDKWTAAPFVMRVPSGRSNRNSREFPAAGTIAGDDPTPESVSTPPSL
jgi:hypothetical protein